MTDNTNGRPRKVWRLLGRVEDGPWRQFPDMEINEAAELVGRSVDSARKSLNSGRTIQSIDGIFIRALKDDETLETFKIPEDGRSTRGPRKRLATKAPEEIKRLSSRLSKNRKNLEAMLNVEESFEGLSKFQLGLYHNAFPLDAEYVERALKNAKAAFENPENYGWLFEAQLDTAQRNYDKMMSSREYWDRAVKFKEEEIASDTKKLEELREIQKESREFQDELEVKTP